VIFANGLLSDPDRARAAIRPDDLLIAADGGSAHFQALDLTPHVLIGDFDSLSETDLERLGSRGVEILRHPAHKDFTDLELALQYAERREAGEIWVYAALGARWDHTLVNLLLPAAADLQKSRIVLIDGPQEIRLIHSGESLEVHGKTGDILSLIPLRGDAHGVTTEDLEYPLFGETLFFGSTRGVSNVFLRDAASVRLERGLLMCVVIHG
jgi:thiamine pyrophosphokinase